jgi:apolipoprotein N-acyltransferase
VNHKGEIIKQLPTEERATLTAYAQTRQGLTPFMRFGLWPLLSFSLFTLILGLWYRAEEINKVISHKKNQ